MTEAKPTGGEPVHEHCKKNDRDADTEKEWDAIEALHPWVSAEPFVPN